MMSLLHKAETATSGMIYSKAGTSFSLHAGVTQSHWGRKLSEGIVKPGSMHVPCPCLPCSPAQRLYRCTTQPGGAMEIHIGLLTCTEAVAAWTASCASPLKILGSTEPYSLDKHSRLLRRGGYQTVYASRSLSICKPRQSCCFKAAVAVMELVLRQDPGFVQMHGL